MKLKCKKEDLLSALNIVTRALAPRSTMPALESVYMETVEDGLKLTCTDLQMGIETTIPVDVKEAGRVLLPGRLLLEVVRKMDDADITIRVGENFAATIQCLQGRTTLQGMNAQDFPKLPYVDESAAVTLPQPALKDMIRRTGFAVAVDDARPILTGCLFHAEDKELTVVALDGFRLAMCRHELEETSSVNAVAPGKYLSELARVLTDDEEELAHLRFSDNHMAAQVGASTVVIRLLEGEFIRYQQLIPNAYQLSLLVDRIAFSNCIDRAALMAREGKNNLIKLSIANDCMAITSNSELGDVYEELPVQTDGKTLDIAFNVRFLSDVMRVIDDENIVLNFNNNVSPCLVTPMEGNAYLFLLLPVRLYGM